MPWPGNPGRLNPVADMTGVVLMAGVAPLIFMHATLAASGIPAGVPTNPPPSALLLATMDYSQRPSIANLKIVAYEGQSLDETNISGALPELLPVRVDRLGTGDTNNAGLYATTITSQDLNDTVSINSAPGVYLYDPAIDRWTQKARFGDVVDESGVKYGGIFGDVALADDESVVFSAGTTEAAPGFGGAQALMLAPPGGGPRQHKVIARTGDILQGTNAVIDGIGLIDVSGADGGLVAQIFASRRQGRNRELGTALIQGSIYQGARSLRVLAASPNLVSSRRQSFTVGETFMASPAEEICSYITHTDPLHSKEILRATRGQRQFQMQRTGQCRCGHAKRGCCRQRAGDKRRNGLVFDTVFLEDGTTALTVSDGQTTRVLLGSGDFVEGLKITNILFGCHPRNVDGNNRLAFRRRIPQGRRGGPERSQQRVFDAGSRHPI